MIEIYKIPFSEIESCGISLKDKDNSWSLKEHATEKKWDMAINGAMFSNGRKGVDPFYYWNITDMVIDGKLNRGGNYSDKGIAIGNPFYGISAYWSLTNNCIGKPVSFIGGAPTLLVDGVIKFDMKGLESSFATAYTQRSAIGIDGSNFYFATTESDKHSLYQVAQAMKDKGCRYAINLDGGGSTAFLKGNHYFTQGRNITSAVGLTLKKKDNPRYKVAIDGGHNILNQSNQSQDGSYIEFEHNDVVAKYLEIDLDRCGIDAEYINYDSANQNIELPGLVKKINATGANICVSIHTDAFSNPNANGITLYSYKLQGESQALAKAIHDSIIPKLGMNDRGIRDGSHLYVVRMTTMACVLCEMGYHTNPNDLKKLKSNSFRKLEAEYIARGICKYFNVEYIPEKIEATKPRYRYSVQTGSFENESNAINMKVNLAKLGIDSVIETEVI